MNISERELKAYYGLRQLGVPHRKAMDSLKSKPWQAEAIRALPPQDFIDKNTIKAAVLSCLTNKLKTKEVIYVEVCKVRDRLGAGRPRFGTVQILLSTLKNEGLAINVWGQGWKLR